MRPEPTQIVRRQQELGFTCSACGADRGCDCNAPAIKKLQKSLQNRRAYEKRQQNQRDSVPLNSIDNITEFPKRPVEANNPWTAHGQPKPDNLPPDDLPPEFRKPIDETGHKYLREFLELNANFTNRFRVWLARAKIDLHTREVLSGAIHRCANNMTLLAQEVVEDDN